MAEVHGPLRPDRRSRRQVSWWHAAVLCAGAAAVTWMVSAVFDTRGPNRVTGPYRVPLIAETCVVVLAVVGGLFTVVTVARRGRPSSRGPTCATATTLIFACVVATGWWRTATALGEGANIGGGLFVLVGPVLIAALLIAAVAIQVATRRNHE